MKFSYSLDAGKGERYIWLISSHSGMSSEPQPVCGRLDNTALSSGKYISPSVIVAEISISEIYPIPWMRAGLKQAERCSKAAIRGCPQGPRTHS